MNEKQQPEPQQAIVPSVKPMRPYPKRYRLANLRAIRRELAAVYSEARNGATALPDACRLAFVLNTLARVMELSDIEPRLRALEQAASDEHRQF